MGGQAQLGRERRGEPGLGRAERGEEGVALRLDLDSVVLGQGGANELVMNLEQRRVTLTKTFEQLRGSLHVCEQEGDDPVR